jgi:hypothetical protein
VSRVVREFILSRIICCEDTALRLSQLRLSRLRSQGCRREPIAGNPLSRGCCRSCGDARRPGRRRAGAPALSGASRTTNNSVVWAAKWSRWRAPRCSHLLLSPHAHDLVCRRAALPLWPAVWTIAGCVQMMLYQAGQGNDLRQTSAVACCMITPSLWSASQRAKL